MTLHEIRPGLRVINRSNAVSKIGIVVQPGDELEVSEDVAAQIAAQNGDFVVATPDAYKRTVPYPPVEDVPEVAADEAEPVKRPAKKSARKRS